MPLIEVDHLRKRYGDTVAVSDVSFSIEEGEIFGILGPNVAGKTTTVECIAGLREPDGGSISVMGLDPLADRDELRSVLGIQLQETQQPDKLESTTPRRRRARVRRRGGRAERASGRRAW